VHLGRHASETATVLHFEAAKTRKGDMPQLAKRIGLIVMMSTVFVASDRRIAADAHPMQQQVIVPQEDRFAPFAVTIHAGDSVQWINKDTDDHTVVSDDFFNTAGHHGTNHLLKGTASNGGRPGTFVLLFEHPGTFVFYCRFHAHLDADHQPAAPGPRGGIQDPTTGNFGTPMMGVVVVLPDTDR
jgi:plastocyanin